MFWVWTFLNIFGGGHFGVDKFRKFTLPKIMFGLCTVTLLLINRFLIFWIFFDVDLSRGGAATG